MKFRQKIEEQFQKISDSMIASNDIGKLATQHYPTRGRNTERVLINFLRKFLPKRYSLSQGHIVSPKGKLSPQLDVIIHDETIFPVATVLESGEKIVFAHSVYAVISVKSNLFEIKKQSQLEDLLKNLQDSYKLQEEINKFLPSQLISPKNQIEISYFGFAFYNQEKEVLDKLNSSEFSVANFLTALAILDSKDQSKGELYINSYYCKDKAKKFRKEVGKRIEHKPKEKNTLLAFYRTLFNRLCEKDIVELGKLSETKKIIKLYKPWGDWGF